MVAVVIVALASGEHSICRCSRPAGDFGYLVRGIDVRCRGKPDTMARARQVHDDVVHQSIATATLGPQRYAAHRES